MNIKTVHIKVRRIDSNGEYSTKKSHKYMKIQVSADHEKDIILELDPEMNYADLKQKFLDLLEITDIEHKVFKIRNSDGILVPLTDVLQQDSSDKYVRVLVFCFT